MLFAHFDGYIQQVALAGGLVVSHGGLDHVPRAIKLVIVAEIGEAMIGVVDLIVRVQVAIGHLRGGHLGYDGIDLLIQHWIGVISQAERSRFQDLIRIGVLEDQPA